MYQRVKVPGMGAVSASARRARVIYDPSTHIGPLNQAHTTELPNVFGGGDMTDFLVRFVNTLDPNGGPEIHWPEYTEHSPQLLAFVEGDASLEVMSDTFRKEAMEFVTQLSLAEPL